MLAMTKLKLQFFLYHFLIITLDTGSSVVLQIGFGIINTHPFITCSSDMYTYTHTDFASIYMVFFIWTLKHEGISEKLKGN